MKNFSKCLTSPSLTIISVFRQTKQMLRSGATLALIFKTSLGKETDNSRTAQNTIHNWVKNRDGTSMQMFCSIFDVLAINDYVSMVSENRCFLFNGRCFNLFSLFLTSKPSHENNYDLLILLRISGSKKVSSGFDLRILSP